MRVQRRRSTPIRSHVRRGRQQAQGKRVAFRADAAFARPAIYEALDARGVQYAIRMPANKNLELEIEGLLFCSPGRPSHKPSVRYKSFRYQAESWATTRRVVAKVEHHVGDLFPRVGFILTTLPLQKSRGRAVVPRIDERRIDLGGLEATEQSGRDELWPDTRAPDAGQPDNGRCRLRRRTGTRTW